MSRFRVVATTAAVVAVLVAAAVLAAVLTGRPEPDRSLLYLSLGDSLAAGYQPDQADDGAARPTGTPSATAGPSPGSGERTDLDGGYVGTVLEALAAQPAGPSAGTVPTVGDPTARAQPAAGAAGPPAPPELVNLGCPGETTQTFTDGGRCEYDEGSQLDAALAVLDDAGDRPVVVTLALGANDVQRCLVANPFAPALDVACAQAGTQAVARTMPAVLHRLTTAAPQARVVVLDYYNPYLAGRLLGERGRVLAEQSEVHAAALNAALAAATEDAGVALAEVSDAFTTGDATPDPTTGRPADVERICAWTWMCSRLDVHPDDEGYDIIAGQVLAALDDPAGGTGTGQATGRAAGEGTGDDAG